MTTARQILEMPIEKVEHDFSYLKGFYYDFLPELPDFIDIISSTSDKVEIKIVKHVDFDGRRFWRLAIVVFEGVPVMITQNAGREGDDHARRFILDMESYGAFLGFIAALPRRPQDTVEGDENTELVTDLDHDYGNKLTSFYNNSLEHVAPRRVFY